MVGVSQSQIAPKRSVQSVYVGELITYVSLYFQNPIRIGFPKTQADFGFKLHNLFLC